MTRLRPKLEQEKRQMKRKTNTPEKSRIKKGQNSLKVKEVCNFGNVLGRAKKFVAFIVLYREHVDANCLPEKYTK
jgi:hypothetical protein